MAVSNKYKLVAVISSIVAGSAAYILWRTADIFSGASDYPYGMWY